MNQIILSIKPRFTDEIYKGNKKVELRKRIGKKFVPDSLIYIYSSSPIKGITGTALIERIEKSDVRLIKKHHLDDARIDTDSFDSYFHEVEDGIMIWLKEVMEFERIIPLNKLKKISFNPPQSFCYATDEFVKFVENHK